jgi:hypothetical protein
MLFPLCMETLTRWYIYIFFGNSFNGPKTFKSCKNLSIPASLTTKVHDEAQGGCQKFWPRYSLLLGGSR